MRLKRKPKPAATKRTRKVQPKGASKSQRDFADRLNEARRMFDVGLAIEAPREVPIVRGELPDSGKRVIRLPAAETAEVAA